MKFLLILFLLFFGGVLVFRLFGRTIMSLILRRVLKTLAKDAKQQEQDYNKYYDSQAFSQNVYVDDEIKVSVPRQQPEKKELTMDDIAEEVEFEDFGDSVKE